MKGVLVKQIQKYRQTLLNGRWIAIDPASGGTSAVGYVIVEQGAFVEVGEIMPAKGCVASRLKQIREALAVVAPAVDLVVIERIGKSRFTSASLLESVGAIISVWGIIELRVAPAMWRKYAGAVYCAAKKAGTTRDSDDAKQIANCVLAMARGRR